MWGLPREHLMLPKLWRAFQTQRKDTKNVSDRSLCNNTWRKPTSNGFSKKGGKVGSRNWESQGQTWLPVGRTLVSKQYSQNQSLSTAWPAFLHVGFTPRQPLPTPRQIVTFSFRFTWAQICSLCGRILRSGICRWDHPWRWLKGWHTYREAFRPPWISGTENGEWVDP